MFCFKSSVKITETFFSFQTCLNLQNEKEEFFSFKLKPFPSFLFFDKVHIKKIVPVSSFFNFKSLNKISNNYFFNFKSSFTFSDKDTDEIFSYFDTYFIKNNKVYILKKFNFYFNTDVKKDSLIFFKFLSFIQERKVLTIEDFEKVYKDFKGD